MHRDGLPAHRREAGNPVSGERLIRHSRRCWRLPLPALQELLERHSFWAQGRSPAELRRMLQGSQAVVSAWRDGALVGFGRASSDGVFRAVLWDVVVAVDHQGQGLGRRIVEALLAAPAVRRAERVYLMTSRSAGFYHKLGFHEGHGQRLLRLDQEQGPGAGAVAELRSRP